MSQGYDDREQTLIRATDRFLSPQAKAAAITMIAVFVLSAAGCGGNRRSAPQGNGDVPAVALAPDNFRVVPVEMLDVPSGTMVPHHKTTLSLEELRTLLDGGRPPAVEMQVDMEGDMPFDLFLDSLSEGDILEIYRVLDVEKAIQDSGRTRESVQETIDHLNGAVVTALLQYMHDGVEIKLTVIPPEAAGTNYEDGDWVLVGVRPLGA